MHTQVRMRAGWAGVVILTLLAARPAPSQIIDIDPAPCADPVPLAIGIPGLTGGPIDLNVRVLLDGVPSSRARDLFTAIARRSYSSLDLIVNPSFQSVSFDGNSAEGLILQAKQTVGGSVPEDIHIVHVLTSKDIESFGNSSVAGLADCIGGVRFPGRAFSVAEVLGGGDVPVGPLTVNFGVDAKVSAHEIGHLMGAHHHYANCVEGIPSEIEPGNVIEVSPCTLMFNVANPSSFNFSGLAGAVARGYGEAFVD